MASKVYVLGPLSLRTVEQIDLWVMKWSYFSRKSWRHGSAQFGRLIVMW